MCIGHGLRASLENAFNLISKIAGACRCAPSLALDLGFADVTSSGTQIAGKVECAKCSMVGR